MLQPAPKRVGNFRIVQRLGEGGMGVVYLAEHARIGRKAAVKILHAELASNDEALERFFNEAKAANAIRHPGVVEIYDCGHLKDGSSYILMEYLAGESLAARLGKVGQLPIAEALDVTLQAASALRAIHGCGIIHRDLKPDNIFLVPDGDGRGHERVKLLDFGIAKLDDGRGTHVTRTGMVLGTPAYMSPEQCRGDRNLGPASDVYSLGLVLYQMVAGRLPFADAGPGEMLLRQVHVAPEPPGRWNAHVPRALERVIMRALEKDPAQRYGTMRELTAALEACSPDEPSLAEHEGLPALSAPPAPPLAGNTTLSASVMEVEGPLYRPAPRPRSSRVLMGLVMLLVTAWGSAWLDHAGVVPAPLHAATDLLASLWPERPAGSERPRAHAAVPPVVPAVMAPIAPPPAQLTTPERLVPTALPGPVPSAKRRRPQRGERDARPPR